MIEDALHVGVRRATVGERLTPINGSAPGYTGLHLCFEQAQPKMYHSPKVDDGVDVFFLIS